MARKQTLFDKFINTISYSKDSLLRGSMITATITFIKNDNTDEQIQMDFNNFDKAHVEMYERLKDSNIVSYIFNGHFNLPDKMHAIFTVAVDRTGKIYKNAFGFKTTKAGFDIYRDEQPSNDTILKFTQFFKCPMTMEQVVS